MKLLRAADKLCQRLAPLSFGPPVTHIYNPLVYARKNYASYLQKYAGGHKQAIFVGMNPGPWGMAQTGVPFGDPELVRTWLRIEGPVERPAREHPKRPVLGLACRRGEVSGRRVWGAVRDHFQTPERFFARFFIANYCPLCFMEAPGRNRTPDKLPAAERSELYAACDEHLRELVAILRPAHVIGIGAFAAQRAAEALAGLDLQLGRVLHPSPANPAANSGWEQKVKAELKQLGLCDKER